MYAVGCGRGDRKLLRCRGFGVGLDEIRYGVLEGVAVQRVLPPTFPDEEGGRGGYLATTNR